MHNRSPGSWLQVGDKLCFFRSKWERNFARYLENLREIGAILDWEYEPQEFWFLKIKRGVRSYKPDFRVTTLSGGTYWGEVKGYLDPRSLTKLRRFKKYYPQETLQLFGKEWFQQQEEQFSHLPGWEPLFKRPKKPKPQ